MMTKLLALFFVLASSAAIAHEYKDCLSNEALALEECSKGESNFNQSYYVSAIVGKGDGRKSIRMENKLYEAGAQFSYTMGDLNLVSLFEYNSETDFLLRYGFADYKYNNLGIRVGKIQHLMGFYNQKRNLPALADWIDAPSMSYRETFKDLLSSGVGYQLYYENTFKDWLGSYTLTKAKLDIYPNHDIVKAYLAQPYIGKLSDKGKITGHNLTVASPDRSLEFRWDRKYFEHDFYSNLPFIPSDVLPLQLDIYGVRKYLLDGGLDVTLERMITHPNVDESATWSTFFNIAKPEKLSAGWSLSARYRPTDKLRFHAFVERWCLDANDCTGKRQQSILGQPAMLFYSGSHGLFAGYEYTKNFSIQMQYTRGSGTNTHFATDNTAKEHWKTLNTRVVYQW